MDANKTEESVCSIWGARFLALASGAVRSKTHRDYLPDSASLALTRRMGPLASQEFLAKPPRREVKYEFSWRAVCFLCVLAPLRATIFCSGPRDQCAVKQTLGSWCIVTKYVVFYVFQIASARKRRVFGLRSYRYFRLSSVRDMRNTPPSPFWCSTCTGIQSALRASQKRKWRLRSSTRSTSSVS